MNLLFFDIECCDGIHLCEFGYVLCDETFRVLEKKCIPVNPDAPFRLGTSNIPGEFHLFYSEKEYNASPLFPDVYNDIKSIIQAPDTIVLGYAVHNDANFIRSACERYGLGTVDFSFYDVQRMYQEKTNGGNKIQISLEKALEQAGIEQKGHLHRSDDDSEMTMLLAQKLCEQTSGIQELIELCPSCIGRMLHFDIAYLTESLPYILDFAEHDPEHLSKSCVQRTLRRYVEQALPKKKSTHPLRGKKICFSTYYEEKHFRDTLALLKYIYHNGGVYCFKASKSHIFVSPPEGEFCARFESVKAENGRKITVLSMDEFLKMADLDEEKVKELPLPAESEFKSYVPKIRSFQSGNSLTKLSDIMEKALKKK